MTGWWLYMTKKGRKDKRWLGSLLGQILTDFKLRWVFFPCMFLASAMPFGELARDYWQI